MDRLNHIFNQVDLETFANTLVKVKKIEESVKSCSEELENAKNNLPMLRASLQKLTCDQSERRTNIKERNIHVIQLKMELKEKQLQYEKLNTKTKDIIMENEKIQKPVCAMINLLKSMFGIEFEVGIQDNMKLEILMTRSKTVKVVLIFDIIEKSFKLESLYPPHPNFATLQKILTETNDIRGFLCSLNEILPQN